MDKTYEKPGCQQLFHWNKLLVSIFPTNFLKYCFTPRCQKVLGESQRINVFIMNENDWGSSSDKSVCKCVSLLRSCDVCTNGKNTVGYSYSIWFLLNQPAVIPTFWTLTTHSYLKDTTMSMHPKANLFNKSQFTFYICLMCKHLCVGSCSYPS